MKKIVIFLFWALFVFVACKKDEDTTTEVKDDSLKVSLKDTATTDIAENYDSVQVLADTNVIFFLPSPKERRELVDLYGNGQEYNFTVMFNNFLNLEQSVKRSLNKKKIPVDISYAKRFVCIMSDTDTMVYDLKIEDQIMGYLLFDGESNPLIKNGVQTKKQTSDDIRNYFNIPNFKLNE